jgi:hypothetical protein
MTFPVIRFLPWAAVFGLGVVVGEVSLPSYDSQLPEAATTTLNATVKESVSDWQATSPAASLPAGFEQRLYAHLDSIVQAAVADALARQPSKAVAATPGKGADSSTLTDNQRQAFEALRARLTSRSITWSQLVSAPELAQLPQPWREKILGQAAEMLTRGELVPAQFIDTH